MMPQLVRVRIRKRVTLLKGLLVSQGIQQYIVTFCKYVLKTFQTIIFNEVISTFQLKLTKLGVLNQPCFHCNVYYF